MWQGKYIFTETLKDLCPIILNVYSSESCKAILKCLSYYVIPTNLLSSEQYNLNNYF